MSIELNKIYNQDCYELLQEIESGTVDLILQDPPYGTTGNEWDIIPDFEVMWKEWGRILKPDGMAIMTASQPFTSKLILSNEKLFKYCWVWNKKLAGNGILAKRQPLKIHEDVVVFGKGTCRYNPIKRKGIYRAKGGITDKHGTFNGAGSEITFNDEYYPESIIDFSGAGMRSDRIHPTEKPIDLMRYMIQTYTQEGEIVFDGYMGSGTTAIAAIKENRRFLGAELSKKYYETANKRIKTELLQTKLF
jgi:site-specific DNA-methyltransferase (adenine-specific)